jgi:hypothetical protein
MKNYMSMGLVASIVGLAIAQPISQNIVVRDSEGSPIGLCWAICFFEPVDCPKGLHSEKQGLCWTCCT